MLQAAQLGAGFVVATSSLNIYANNCNDVVSAEAAMMTKELVIERYGPLKYTMGNGGSAASMQQHLLAENYPGLLDGLTTSQVFEDHWTQVQGSLDCRVLMHYFWPTSPLSQPGPRRRAAQRAVPDRRRRDCRCGAAIPANPDNLCGQKVIAFGADRTELVPTANVACGLTAAQLWNPVTNPTGERCGIADFMRAVFGVTVTPDAPNGKGRLAVDNVGVQYGLAALQRGEITAEQFVDLNAKVGGIDIDGNFVAAAHRGRSGRAADRLRDRPRQQRHAALRTFPRSTTAPAARWTTPASIPPTRRSPTARAWTVPTATTTTRSSGSRARAGWCRTSSTRCASGSTPASSPRATPASWPAACEGDLTCNGTWRHYGSPRIAAGGPLSSDVVKCRLKPLARSDYAASFSDAQWATLQATFPTGVCDYSQPGVEQRPPKARWLTFADGPGGRALGAAPAAEEFVTAPVGGTVPATLSLSIGPASFGAFTPGAAREYVATTTATVISTAGDASLTHSDPGHLANGPFTLPQPLRVELSKSSWTAPVSNDAVTVTFRQAIGATDALRTGTYARTLTFTLSTTTP